MNPGTDGDISQCHRVSHLDINIAGTTSDNLLSNLQTCWTKNVCITIWAHLARYGTALFAMADERNEGRAVRVIFNAFDSSWDGIPGGAFKIDDTIKTLVTTTLVAYSNTTGDRATAGFFRKANGEAGMGTAFVET